MKGGAQSFVLAAFLIAAIVTSCFTAQPSTADKVIEKDRTSRQAAFKAGYSVATKPKWGFFGTIFNLILEQVNDTKSAYNQISDLVNNQFADDNTVTMQPVTVNGTTETPKITRAEFLKILDRNLKGLARLRNLEWREAKKLVVVKENIMRNLHAQELTIQSHVKSTRPQFSNLWTNLCSDSSILGGGLGPADSAANLRAYKDEVFRGKKSRNRR